MFVEIAKGAIINTDKIINLSHAVKQVKERVDGPHNSYYYEYPTKELFEVFLEGGYEYEIKENAYNRLIEMLNTQTVIN